MNKSKQGRLIVISAPSGCGKTTIVDRLLAQNQSWVRSVSYTTRPPRTGEANGRDYFFMSAEEFELKQRQDFFLESAKVFSHFYGTSRAFVADCLAQGRDVILAIDVQGMKQLCAKKDASMPMTSIFIMPPSLEALKSRLEKRQTETKKEIGKRLKIAEEEMAARSRYDHVVVNQDINQAVREIEDLIK
ncbi:MAG: guanylate kinase [Candidatus Omnitrophica bacterium]|nr:guanylate kinase [Candidatus Omnitrophota bacterium]